MYVSLGLPRQRRALSLCIGMVIDGQQLLAFRLEDNEHDQFDELETWARTERQRNIVETNAGALFSLLRTKATKKGIRHFTDYPAAAQSYDVRMKDLYGGWVLRY